MSPDKDWVRKAIQRATQAHKQQLTAADQRLTQQQLAEQQRKQAEQAEIAAFIKRCEYGRRQLAWLANELNIPSLLEDIRHSDRSYSKVNIEEGGLDREKAPRQIYVHETRDDGSHSVELSYFITGKPVEGLKMTKRGGYWEYTGGGPDNNYWEPESESETLYMYRPQFGFSLSLNLATREVEINRPSNIYHVFHLNSPDLQQEISNYRPFIFDNLKAQIETVTTDQLRAQEFRRNNRMR